MDAVDRITPALRLGERVVVRYRLPDGSATDVVGWLEIIDSERLTARDGRGQLVEVVRTMIVAARRAPPARGGQDPMRTSADELERVALPAWVAYSEPLGEWTLRAAGGFTGRANSCLSVGDPGTQMAEAAERVMAFSRQHGIAPMAQVIAGSEPERHLVALGWEEVHVAADVLVTRLNALLEATAGDPAVQFSERLQPAWFDAFQRSRPSDANPQVVHFVLENNPPLAFAGVEHGDRLLAIGRAQVTRDWVGIAALWTDPQERGRGWATKIMNRLGHWAARFGARNVYLQVATGNEAALRACSRAGFVRHHSYRYLGPSRDSWQH
ncbi:MAG: GNAT family N-acetyltransferase [Propionibacteriaceae bacterium]|nr:GNAT family N-acetyltransferase [Propionibacteriaceae bacterium]